MYLQVDQVIMLERFSSVQNEGNFECPQLIIVRCYDRTFCVFFMNKQFDNLMT